MSGGVIARPTTASEEQVQRYSYAERAYHWINAFSYTYLLLTGLALFTPLLYWLGYVLGGNSTTRFWHPWVGLVFAYTIVWMHRKWKGDMASIPQDDQWNKNLKAYMENRDESMPPQGRFNAGQKKFWRVMFLCTFILLITGLVMWMPERIPPQLHWIGGLMIFIHSLTALITIAAFIIHVYMSVWVTPGSVQAMMDGNVSHNWARTHHRLWYEKITGRRN